MQNTYLFFSGNIYMSVMSKVTARCQSCQSQVVEFKINFGDRTISILL